MRFIYPQIVLGGGQGKRSEATDLGLDSEPIREISSKCVRTPYHEEIGEPRDQGSQVCFSASFLVIVLLQCVTRGISNLKWRSKLLYNQDTHQRGY